MNRRRAARAASLAVAHRVHEFQHLLRDRYQQMLEQATRVRNLRRRRIDYTEGNTA